LQRFVYREPANMAVKCGEVDRVRARITARAPRLHRAIASSVQACISSVAALDHHLARATLSTDNDI
jgi:hypothetical protein